MTRLRLRRRVMTTTMMMPMMMNHHIMMMMITMPACLHPPHRWWRHFSLGPHLPPLPRHEPTTTVT
jgi:hypothetical protein